MKRLLLFLATVMCATTMLQAQDTIRYGDTNSRYMFVPIVIDTNLGSLFYSEAALSVIRCNSDSSLAHSYYSGYVVDRPTWIYGIASTLSFSSSPITVVTSSVGEEDQQFEYDVYAMLVEKEGGHYYHSDSVKWNNQGQYRYFVYPQRSPYYSPFPNTDTVVGAFEFYFSTPRFVVDTFYIGMWFTHLDCDRHDDTALRTVAWEAGGFYSTYMNYPDIQDINEVLFESPLGFRRSHYHIGFFFPIIMPPDTDSFECPRVENFRQRDYVDGRPVLEWEAQAGQRPFQVAYGPADQDPDSFRVVQSLRPPCVLPADGLDSMVLYAARCRGRCHHMCQVHDTIMWGEWSDTVEFYTGSRRPGSVGAVSPKGALSFTLSPNPARDEVTVTVEGADGYGCWLTLRDEAGRELLRRQMGTYPGSSSHPSQEGTSSLTLSTRGLAAGLNFVTLESPKGTSTQKLVVER